MPSLKISVVEEGGLKFTNSRKQKQKTVARAAFACHVARVFWTFCGFWSLSIAHAANCKILELATAPLGIAITIVR